MKIVTIGSSLYLGELEEVKGGVILKDSMAVVNEVTVKTLGEYLRRSNTGKLDKPIEIKGTAITYSTRDLTDDLELEFGVLKLKFAQAEKLAIPELVNKKFTELVG